MMKKIFISFSFLMMAILPVFAQNNHWEYSYAGILTPFNVTSAVTVVHSNGRAYVFFANANSISLFESDPVTMLPLVPEFKYYASGITIQGAYEDFNGDILIYGSYNNYPAVALYDPAIFHIRQFAVDTTHYGDYFINGCCGYDINGNMTNMLVLEYAGRVVPIDWSSLGLYMTGSVIPLNTLRMSKEDRISDVAWDPYNSCFAAVGYQYAGNGPQLFLLGFQYDNSNLTFTWSSPFSWYLQNAPYFYYAEYRTNLEIINDNQIIVGQAIRDSNGEWIWLTNIGNYSFVNNSEIFLFPSPKLFMSDMKYDDDNNRLTILGEMNGCNVTYIAQVDPMTLMGMKAVQIKGNKPYTNCQYNQNLLYGNDISLQKLELNPYVCNHILATGNYNNTAVYVTETYDIAYSVCDILIYPYEQKVSCNPGVATPNLKSTLVKVFNGYIPLISNQQILAVFSCLDSRPCGSKEVDSTKSVSIEKIVSVNIMGNGTLDFQGFEKEVDYMIYDVTGRVASTGKTENGLMITNLGCSGLYIIIAKDQFGNTVTKKFVYTRE